MAIDRKPSFKNALKNNKNDKKKKKKKEEMTTAEKGQAAGKAFFGGIAKMGEQSSDAF